MQIEGDAPIDLSTKTTNKSSTLTIILPGAIYGLGSYKYSSFPVGSLIKRIEVTESSRNGNVEISCILDNPIAQNTKSKSKGNRWLILITNKPQIEYSWSAPQATGMSTPAGEPAQPSAEPKKTERKSEASVVKQKNIPRTQKEIQNSAPGDKSALTNFVMVHRGKTRHLKFTLSSPVKIQTKREKNIFKVAIPYTQSKLSEKSYILQDALPFKKVTFEKRQRNNINWCIVLVSMVSSYQDNILVQQNGNTISLFPTVENAEQLAIWTAAQGKKVAYKFTNLPSYKTDYEAISQKAEFASKKELSERSTFKLKEASQPVPEPIVEPEPEPEPIVKAEPELQPEPEPEPVVKSVPKPVIEKSKPKRKPTQLIIVKDQVNMRKKPSAKGRASVIKQLSLGTRAMGIDIQGDWHKVDVNGTLGWVHNSLVQDSSEVSQSLWNKIKGTEVNNESSEEEILAAIERKSSQIPPIESESEHAMLEQSGMLNQQLALEATSEKMKKSGGPELIEYHVYGRDPFLPLEETSADSLPNVYNVKLVGILLDQSDKLALLEDIENPGVAFALRENDPIQGGRVLKIQNNSVVFLLSTLGISRTFALKLNEEEHIAASSPGSVLSGVIPKAATDDASLTQSSKSDISKIKSDMQKQKTPTRKKASSSLLRPSAIPQQ